MPNVPFYTVDMLYSFEHRIILHVGRIIPTILKMLEDYPTENGQ